MPSHRSRPRGAADPPPVTEHLTEPPAVGPLLRRAVGRGLTGRTRGRSDHPLPQRRVEVADQRVDVEQWARYARVCGMSVGTVLPGTFLHVLAFPAQVAVMAAPDFPFPVLGLVHLRNEMQMLAPVRMRDRVTVSAWADSVRPHARGATVDLHACAQTGREVRWRGRSTYLVRGVEVGGPSGGPDAARPDPGVGSEVDLASLRPWAQWSLPADLGRRYASASGDVNPIHLNPVAAKAFGFPRTIVHGMWTHARVLAALQGRIPTRHTVAVSFRKPVLLPSTVVFRARPTVEGHAFAVTDRDGGRDHLMGTLDVLG